MGLTRSPIALGTVKLGRNTDVKYPDSFELPHDETVTELLQTARDLGVNLIDTAPAYGQSEERLGQLLPGPRQDWVLCTKAGETYESGRSKYDFSGDAITASVHRSLKRLNTDYLDLVLIHSDGNDLDIINKTDAVTALENLKSSGEVRQVGMSTKTVEGGLAAIDFSDVLMVTLNLDDDSQLPVIEAAAKSGVGILLKKVFASGHQDPARSLGYVLGVPGVDAAVTGTLSPDHLRRNVEIANRIKAP